MKKYFCVLTALCLLASIVAVGTMSVAATEEQDEQVQNAELTTTETVAETVVFGDVNDDCAINMKDVLTLRNYIVGIEVTYNEKNADANDDGTINMKDVLALRQLMAGILPCLPPQKAPTTTKATAVDGAYYGDANGDGAINMKDVLTLRAFSCGHINFSETENVWIAWDMNPEHPKQVVTVDLTNADANMDGEINMKDVLTVRKFLAGILSGL